MNQAEQNKLDHERAQTYSNKWIVTIQNELFTRGLILTSAMDKFNKFLDLPEKSSRASHIWDLAYGILSTAVPALRLTKFIADVKTNSEKALALAKRAQQSVKTADAAKYLASRGAQGAGKIAKKIDDAKDKIEKVKDAYEGATKEVDSGTSLLSKLDATKGPIMNLINDGRLTLKSWETALDAELIEFENRLNGRKSNDKSLDAYIQELLKPVPGLTEDDLKEVESLYLREMIAKHVRDNVKFVTIKSTALIHGKFVHHRPEFELRGLNDTQWETIMDLFGPTAKRGKIFYKPIVFPYEPAVKYNYISAIGGVQQDTEHRRHVYQPREG